MSWKFNFAEESPGHYLCTGLRDSGHSVKAHCLENDISRIFQLAFDLEIELDTSPSRALFEVIRGAKPEWPSRYDDHAFGSWFVESATNSSYRVVYDGKQSCLAAYCGNSGPKWESTFRSAKDVGKLVFQLLAPGATE